MTTTALHCYLLRKYFTAGQIHQIPKNPTVITVCPTLPPLCGSHHHNHFTTCPCHPSCLHPFIYFISSTKIPFFKIHFFSPTFYSICIQYNKFLIFLPNTTQPFASKPCPPYTCTDIIGFIKPFKCTSVVKPTIHKTATIDSATHFGYK